VLSVRAPFRVTVIGMIGMKLQNWSVLLGMVTLATAVTAGPRVVADSACPHYAVDIEAFATCDGDRVAGPDLLRIDASDLLAEPEVPLHKRTGSGLYVDAVHAEAIKRRYLDEVVFVDIRSPVELGLTGHPKSVDLNVPFRDFVQPLVWDDAKGAWSMETNPRFSAQLDDELRRRGATHDTVVMLLCRSGDRSAQAADALSLLGYRYVVSVVDGYEGDIGPDGRRSLNGWKNAGLPWTAQANAALVARRR
jgi:rhodanese-related sulfurtransferase